MSGFGSSSPPHNVAARLAEAERLRLTGRKAESEAICREILSRKPNAPALAMLALLLAEKGDFAQSESLMRQAIALEPKAAALYGHLGALLFQQGDSAGAEKAYQKAVSLDSGNWENYYNLGVARAALGRVEEALAAQRRALALKPGHAPAQVQAGFLLHQLGDNDAALAMLEAVRLPGYFDAHYYRGMVLAALGRFADAATAQQKAIALAPQRFEGHLALGNALVQTGKDQEALVAYRRAIEIDPSYLPAHRQFNELAWMAGHDVRSSSSYTYARRRIGDTPDLLLAEAELKLRFKDADDAAALLEKARAQDSSRADVAEAQARAFEAQGRTDESHAAFARAIAAQPDNLAFRHAFTESLLKSGDLMPAKKLLEETLGLAPRHQITLAHQTLLARLTGDTDILRALEAKDFVQEIILPVPPGFADARSFNAALAEDLALLHTSRNAPMDQTLNGGTQTAGALFGRPSRALALLEENIRDAVGQYIKALPDDAAHPFLGRKAEAFDFAGSWSCRLFSSGFHSNHVHSEGWISSAYYVDLPQQVAEGEGGQGALAFGQSRFLLGPRDAPHRHVTPGIGKLVLFPSYFWHGTIPFASDRARLSVAFDVVPR